MQRKPTTIKTILLGILISSACLVFGYNPGLPNDPTFPGSPQSRTENSNNSDIPAIESGGEISEDEIVCDEGVPTFLKNVTSPSGDIEGFIIFKWEKRTAGGSWEIIPGATVIDYIPGTITETTEYRRGCRELIHQPWSYSNIVTKTVVQGIEEIKVSPIDVTCKDGSNGSANAVAIGGTPSYDYEWSNGTTNHEISDVAAGSYEVTVTDRNGCTYSETVEIGEPEFAIILDESFSISPTCPGFSDGVIFVEAYQGQPPYEFTWSDGNDGPINPDVPAGSYNVTVVDALGCSASITGLFLEGPESFRLEEATEPTTCFGDSDGSTEIELTGGTAPYHYLWPDGSDVQSRSDLEAGSYTVNFIDMNGCFFTKDVVIPEPTELEATAFIVNNNLCKASANIVPSGGTAPYTYEWEDGSTNGYLTNLCTGIYVVEILDANDCKTTETLEITSDYEKESISIEVIVNPLYQKGHIVIKLPYNDFADIRVFTTAGQLVETFNHENPQSENKINLALDLDKYSNGIYLIEVTSGGLSLTEKIAVAKQ